MVLTAIKLNSIFLGTFAPSSGNQMAIKRNQPVSLQLTGIGCPQPTKSYTSAKQRFSWLPQHRLKQTATTTINSGRDAVNFIGLILFDLYLYILTSLLSIFTGSEDGKVFFGVQAAGRENTRAGIREALSLGICRGIGLALTTLTLAISNIVENSSTWTLKAHCLSNLVWLNNTLSQLAEAAWAYQAAEALYLTTGNLESMGMCLITRADLLRCQGRFIQSQNLLEDLQHSDSWKSLSETTKARAWLWLDNAQMYTFTVSADKLFVKSSEDRIWGLHSKVWHWQATFYHGGDAVQVKTHLEDLFLQCKSTGDVYDRRDALCGLAEVALCEGRLSDAMDNLQKIVGIFEGQNLDDVSWYTVWKAAVASKQGNSSAKLRNPSNSLSYGSACIELATCEYDAAESHFTATGLGVICDTMGHESPIAELVVVWKAGHDFGHNVHPKHTHVGS
ncbi:hypothetical protein EDB19DRAFT_2028705 [Suillus lakei]|nr:hypothetical protein EDB19DRAFT_2028705 [Suillus lakei]